MITQIDLNALLSLANDEVELLPYFVKLELKRLGIPAIIDPTNIRDPDYTVESGVLDYKIDVDTMIMEIVYYAKS